MCFVATGCESKINAASGPLQQLQKPSARLELVNGDNLTGKGSHTMHCQTPDALYIENTAKNLQRMLDLAVSDTMSLAEAVKPAHCFVRNPMPLH